MTATVALPSNPPVIPETVDFPDASSHTHPSKRSTALPVTVQTGFLMASGHQRHWIAVSESMVTLAASWPGCHRIHRMEDRGDGLGHTIISTWDDMGTYHRFVRESGMLWLVRAMGDARMSSEICGLEHT